MINQFGVKGFNLVNGAFEFYEITLNGVFKGLVRKHDDSDPCWSWETEFFYGDWYHQPKEAIEAIKKHLTGVAK